MTTEELKEILRLHKLWLNDKEGGVRADLRGANMTGCDLREANLREANLREANLCWADLRGADLRGANLCEANFHRARNIIQFGPMPTSGRIVYGVRHDSGWMVQAGCFWGTVDELEAKVKASHNCPSYLRFIEILRKP